MMSQGASEPIVNTLQGRAPPSAGSFEHIGLATRSLGIGTSSSHRGGEGTSMKKRIIIGRH